MKYAFNRVLNALLRRLDDRLVDVYASSNAHVRRFLLWPLYHVRRLVLFLQSGMVFQVYLLRGTAAEGGAPLTAAYLASGRGMEFLARRLFQEGTYSCEPRGKAWFWQLTRAAEQMARAADLVVIERNSLLSWTPGRGQWVTSPTWVRMVIDLEPGSDWSQLERGFKKHQKNIRRFQKTGYTYRISRSQADFDLFYDQMYVPLVTQRHTQEAFVDSRKHLLKLFRQGFLLLIIDKDGRPIAGDLDHLNGDTLFGVACGVLNGDPALLEEGALSAIYYYALQWCHENNIRRCDIAEVRPFVEDGVYNYKRRWGYQPARELWNTREWLLWVPNHSPAALAWLSSHPFLPEFARYHGSPTPPAGFDSIPRVAPLENI
jgi:hypothetical protein